MGTGCLGCGDNEDNYEACENDLMDFGEPEKPCECSKCKARRESKANHVGMRGNDADSAGSGFDLPRPSLRTVF